MKLWRLVAVVSLAILLTGFTWLTLHGRFVPWDSAVIRSVASWHSAALTTIMTAITLLGNQAVYLASVAVAVFLIMQKRWGALGEYILLVGGQEVANFLFKAIIARPRPSQNPLVQETNYSFPSGHSMAACVFYGALAVWLWRKGTGGRYRWAWFVSAVVIIAAVGLSRVYLGVHYPTDVMAGFLTGALWLLIALREAPFQSQPQPAIE